MSERSRWAARTRFGGLISDGGEGESIQSPVLVAPLIFHFLHSTLWVVRLPNGLVSWSPALHGEIQPFCEGLEIIQRHCNVDDEPRESLQLLVI